LLPRRSFPTRRSSDLACTGCLRLSRARSTHGILSARSAADKCRHMTSRMRTALYGWVAALAVTIFSAAPAQAQFHPEAVPELATGEQFHIEASAGWWHPGADR